MARSARYVMTPARRAALKKAQLASAKKRRRRRVAIAGGAAVGVVGAGVARHKLSGSRLLIVRNEPYLIKPIRVNAQVRGRHHQNKTVNREYVAGYMPMHKGGFQHNGGKSFSYRHIGKKGESGVVYFHKPVFGQKAAKPKYFKHKDVFAKRLIGGTIIKKGIKRDSGIDIHSANRSVVQIVAQGKSRMYGQKVDSSAIPLYNAKARKDWPHVGAADARIANSRAKKAKSSLTKRKKK